MAGLQPAKPSINRSLTRPCSSDHLTGNWYSSGRICNSNWLNPGFHFNTVSRASCLRSSCANMDANTGNNSAAMGSRACLLPTWLPPFQVTDRKMSNPLRECVTAWVSGIKPHGGLDGTQAIPGPSGYDHCKGHCNVRFRVAGLQCNGLLRFCACLISKPPVYVFQRRDHVMPRASDAAFAILECVGC